MTVQYATSASAPDKRPQPFVDGDKRPYNAVIALMLGTAAGIVGVASPLGSAFGIRPWHVLCFLALGVALYVTSTSKVGSLRLTALDVMSVLFVGWCVVADMVSASETGYSSDPLGAVAPIYFVPGYWAARIVIANGASIGQFFAWFSYPALVLGPIAGLQVVFPAFSSLVLRVAPGPGLEARILDGRLIRATSLVGHWTGSGFMFCCLLAAACTAMIIGKDAPHRPKFLVWTAVAAALGIVASLTFAAIACAVLIVVVFLRVSGARFGAIAVTGSIALVLYWQFGSYLGERVEQQTAYRPAYVPDWLPNTLAYRYRIWSEQTIPVIQERLWTGWGAGLYSGGGQRPALLAWHSPESQWFGVLVMYGVVAFAALAFIVLRALWISWKLCIPLKQRYLMPIMALFFAAAISSLTVSVYTSRGFPVGFWVILGVLVSVLTSRRQYAEAVQRREGQDD